MPTLDEQIAELKRELALREQFYRKEVQRDPTKRPQLERQYLRMKAALQTLLDVQSVRKSAEIFEQNIGEMSRKGTRKQDNLCRNAQRTR